MSSILGISAFFHDSASALIVEGDIVAAVQEERFSREKNDAAFPSQAIAYCLKEASMTADRLDLVAFYEQPLTKFERLLETYISYAPAGFASFKKALPLWLKKKLHIPKLIRNELRGYRGRIVYPSHHESHAASAFFPSPFEKAAILTMDGVGEWSTTTLGYGEGNRIELKKQLCFPHSLGLLYSAFTYYCGFKVNSGEYKLMGLAPYGEPKYVDLIFKHLIFVRDDGSYHLDMSYFNYCQGLTMTSGKFHRLFGGPPRNPDSRIDQRHMDLASSIQRVTEEIMSRCARHVWSLTGEPENLVIAGGVGLNCVANGKLLRDGPFKDIWVQPASGDAGGALGAALFSYYQLLNRPRVRKNTDHQRCSLLGPSFSNDEIRKTLEKFGACYRYFEHENDLLEHVVGEISKERVVGWFQGKEEFGPRALGSRSILGDPRSSRLQSQLNLKIKFRESFRPFAPSVLREHVSEWFGVPENKDSPYMLFVAPVLDKHRVTLSEEEKNRLKKDPDLSFRVNIVRSSVPAITHVDLSARVQTVDERHERYYRLIKKFHEKTGVPLLINTSFNLSWDPIVLSPREAILTFMQSEMDVLVLENYVLDRGEQPLGLVFGAKSEKVSIPEQLNPWVDPCTREKLLVSEKKAVNLITGRRYPLEQGIPQLFALSEDQENDSRDVTEVVKSFYEKTPFPNYDDIDNIRVLIEKSRRGIFARLLNEQIPFGAKVLEVGCGTGQLTNFLSIGHRTVLGIDICMNSLRLAQKFKEDNALERACFAQMNLFRPALPDDFFDFVISLGVLHHTSNARVAFQRISHLVKPGGFLVVGLYNAISRKLHYARRSLFRFTGITSRLLDPHFKNIRSNPKREAWFRDQYCHPHETSHTVSEVMGWLDVANLEFVNSIPKPTLRPSLEKDEQLFSKIPSGSRSSRFMSQLMDMGSGFREGGLFVVIAQKQKSIQETSCIERSERAPRKEAIA